MFMWQRNKDLRDKLFRYLDLVRAALESMSEGLNHYAGQGLDDRFARLVEETHESESAADELRHEIELDLYEKSLLPEAREDILVLLERLDLIPNRAEDILRWLWIQRLDLPAQLRAAIVELGSLGLKMFDLLGEAVGDALNRQGNIPELTRRIEAEESVADRLEQRIISEIFASAAGTAEKILFRDIVSGVGSLCDLAEEVGFFLRIFAVKRHV